MYILIANPPSLPVHPTMERVCETTNSKSVFFGNSRLELLSNTLPIIHLSRVAVATFEAVQEKHGDTKPESALPPTEPQPQAQPKNNQNAAASPANGPPDRRSFWERVFKMPPLRKRVETALTEEWKLSDVKPRNIEWLLSDEGEESRHFFLDGLSASQYRRLLREFKCGFEDRNGRIVDDSFETLNEYGPDLVKNYQVLIDNRELIKRYFAGVFRDGRIGTASLVRISTSMWFGPFGPQKFKVAANTLRTRFQIPNHVIGPMLASVGDTIGLRQVLGRRTAPQEFQQLLNLMAPPASEGSGNAFAPALQLMVLGEENKIPFKAISAFVEELKLRPKDFGAFSAIVYNLGPYRFAGDIKCPTFAQFLRRMFDEYGADINQESARLFVLSFAEFKDNPESLQAFLSPQYTETKGFLRSLGIPIPSTVWNMERIGVLAQTLTPAKRAKIASLVRELSEEVRVADVMFLADISDNEEECKLLLNRPALISAVKEIKIDRIIERSHNDLVKELEREIDAANRNGLYRTVRRLTDLLKQEKRAYTEQVEPDKLTNIQLSRLLIFHRSINMPGFLDTLGWNVSLDLQNDRSEGGGYLGYDKDMAMVTIVAGQPGDNKQYRPENLFRAPASLALFHNHAFTDSFVERYLGFLSRLFFRSQNKNSYAGPSGWVGAKKGDISAAADSELPSFIITKVGYPQNPDGSRNKKALLVNLDWVIVDRQTGEALRSDRGVYTVPFYGEADLGKLKWPSSGERRRQEKEKRERCPLGMIPATQPH